jgi:hypothetical protein
MPQGLMESRVRSRFIASSQSLWHYSLWRDCLVKTLYDICLAIPENLCTLSMLAGTIIRKSHSSRASLDEVASSDLLQVRAKSKRSTA